MSMCSESEYKIPEQFMITTYHMMRKALRKELNNIDIIIVHRKIFLMNAQINDGIVHPDGMF